MNKQEETGTKKVCVLAVVSFILSILFFGVGVFLGPIGFVIILAVLIMGIIALRKTNNSEILSGRGLAIAAITISSVALGINLVITTIIMTAVGTSGDLEKRLGEAIKRPETRSGFYKPYHLK